MYMIPPTVKKGHFLKNRSLFTTLFAVLAALFILHGPYIVRADETEGVFNAYGTEYESRQPVREYFEDLSDSDALLSEYLEYTVSGSSPSRKRGAVPGDLSGINLELYDQLIPAVSAIASGEVSSTEIHLDLTGYAESLKAAGEKTSWTAEDLGLESLFDGSDVSSEAERAFASAIGLRVKSAIHSLCISRPYEMYWRGLQYSYYYPYKTSEESGEPVLTYDDEFEIWISVSADYAVPLREYDGSYDEENEQLAEKITVSEDGSISETTFVFSKYTTDTSRISAVNTAVENAGNIVSDASAEGLGDVKKLYYYRDQIQALAGYNASAAGGNYPSGYGDPWQIIYVFDNDPETNVVCEGFSKAFQYLCDLTVFDNAGISCRCVTGRLGPLGPHMWNIVSIGGKNYFADITNDSGSNDLFLQGYISGSADEGYTFSSTFSYIYSYDSDTLTVCSAEELAIEPDRTPEAPRPPALKNRKTGITVAWESSENADGFVICRRSEGTDLEAICTLNSAELTSWIDTGVSAGTLYSYCIRAFSYDDVLEEEHFSTCSDASDIWRISRPSVTGFTSKAEGFVLSWSELPEADGYLIYRKPEGGSYARIRKIKSSSVLSWTDKTAEEGTIYSYKLIAYKILDGAAYKSSASAEKTKYRLDPPAVPVLKKASGGIDVSWAAKAAADGYIVYRKAAGGAYAPVKTLTGTVSVSWKDTSAEPGVKYYYKIKACKAIGDKTYYSLCSVPATIRY